MGRTKISAFGTVSSAREFIKRNSVQTPVLQYLHIKFGILKLETLFILLQLATVFKLLLTSQL